MVSKVEESAVVVSPCVGICALDDNDVCVGCFRTGEEISAWGVKTSNEKIDILEKVKKREASSYI